MNYKDLADLIFPNAKEIKYYEEKYPERDLKERSSCFKICTKSNRIRTYWWDLSKPNCKKAFKPNTVEYFF